MSFHRISAFLLILAFVSTRSAYADTISHFAVGAPGQFGDVTNLLDNVGIASGVMGSENFASGYQVPGSGAQQLTFDFVRDTGSYKFTFGFFDLGSVTADPATQQQLFATQAISNGTAVFDDRVDNVGASASFLATGGQNLGFYLIPNNTLDAFLANPSAFYPSQTGNNRLRSPLFSTAAANPGGFDQLLSFEGSGFSLFTFEDLTRAGRSDEDFTDLAFTVSAVAAPEPATLSLFAIVGAAGFLGYRRRRRES